MSVVTPDRAPTCAVRGRWDAEGGVRVTGRQFALDAAGRSLESKAARPSALELLASSLAVDLLAGLGRESLRAGVTIHEAEMNVSAFLDNPLVPLGVVGEAGSAAVVSMRGALYVSSDADDRALASLWALVTERASVHATLLRCVEQKIELKPMP
jgi:hypothetical protein